MKTKKIISILTAGVLTASALTGCSSGLTYDKDLVGEGKVYTAVADLKKLDDKKAEKVIDTLNKKYESVDYSSMELDAKILCNMEMSAEGMSMNIGMDLTDSIAYDLTDSIMYQKLDGTVSVLGMNVPMTSEIYAKKDGTDAIIYSKTSASNEEGSWEKDSDSWEAFGDDSNYGIGGFSKNSIKAVYNDEKEKAYVLELNPGSYEGLDSVLDNTLNENNSMGMDFDLDKAHMYMSVDDGLGIIGIYADLKDAMNLEYEDVDTKISDFYMLITYKSINEKMDIKIPDEALKASSSNTDNPALDPSSDSVSKLTETEVIKPSVSAPDTSIGDSQLNQVIINGKTVVIPCKFSDLTAIGLVPDEDVTIEPDNLEYIRLKSSDNETIGVFATNDTDTPLPLNDCTVSGVDYTSYSVSAASVSISGFHIGDKKEDIVNTLGTPTSTYNGEEYSSIAYEADNSYIDFSFENDILVGMSIEVY